MPSLLLPAPTAGMEPLIVDQLQLVPATLKLPAEGQPHRLDGAHQGTALRFAALTAVDVFAQPACCPADIFRAAALNQFGDDALKAPKVSTHDYPASTLNRAPAHKSANRV